MGNSLHNKIHLGRTSVLASALASRRARSALLLGAFVSIALAWLTIRALK